MSPPIFQVVDLPRKRRYDSLDVMERVRFGYSSQLICSNNSRIGRQRICGYPSSVSLIFVFFFCLGWLYIPIVQIELPSSSHLKYLRLGLRASKPSKSESIAIFRSYDCYPWRRVAYAHEVSSESFLSFLVAEVFQENFMLVLNARRMISLFWVARPISMF